MTAEAKATRLAELAVQLLATEQEEAMVWLVLDEGMHVRRRANTDPRAALQIPVE